MTFILCRHSEQTTDSFSSSSTCVTLKRMKKLQTYLGLAGSFRVIARCMAAHCVASGGCFGRYMRHKRVFSA